MRGRIESKIKVFGDAFTIEVLLNFVLQTYVEKLSKGGW